MSSALGVVGIVLYAGVGILYLASGLVVPYPWVFGMWALWLGGIVVLVQVLRTAEVWTPAVAAGAVLVWVLVVQVGSWLFDWTA